MPQIGSIAFNHQHAKDFVVDVPLDESCRPRQDLVQIQRGVHFFADFRQSGQDFGRDLRSTAQRSYCRMFIRMIHEV